MSAKRSAVFLFESTELRRSRNRAASALAGCAHNSKGARTISVETNASSLEEALADIELRFRSALAHASDETAIDELRVAFLGRQGEMTLVRRRIGTLPAAMKPQAGKLINEAAERLEGLLTDRMSALGDAALDAELAETIDVTFPGNAPAVGSLHPLRLTTEAIVDYFRGIGFAVALGPELEREYYNFDALNIAPDHPAREGLDSFYLGPDYVLRTHTSPVQIRTMEKYAAPVALVVPGTVYRRDAVDARHSYMFHQVEGLFVGPGANLGSLRGTLTGLCRSLFGAQQAVRFRPSFFPFTEPSAEVDTTCPGCGGSGCGTCGGSGWIEIGGAGMVHPRVLTTVGYDADAVTGWAFGLGVERVAMVRHGIDDIRAFFENDETFLEQLA